MKTCDFTPAATELEREDVSSLMSLSIDSYNVVPLSQIVFKRKPGSTTLYDYELHAMDGRVWRQVIDFSTSKTDPSMTFDVPDHWKGSDFTRFRDLRAQLIRMVATSALETFEAGW